MPLRVSEGAQGGWHVKYSNSPGHLACISHGQSDSNVFHTLLPKKSCILCPVLDMALTRLRINWFWPRLVVVMSTSYLLLFCWHFHGLQRFFSYAFLVNKNQKLFPLQTTPMHSLIPNYKATSLQMHTLKFHISMEMETTFTSRDWEVKKSRQHTF